MKEFIFTWRVENISYSWHKKRSAITSPSFVANTLFNTVWFLQLYPKGFHFKDWISLYLYRGKDEGPEHFLLDCELSCVSANNLTLASHTYPYREQEKTAIGNSKFLKIHEVFVQRKALYLQKNCLTLRCRMWAPGGDVDEYGQSFGRTRLEVERILSVRYINPGKGRTDTFDVLSKRNNKLLIKVSTVDDGSSLEIEARQTNIQHIKFFTWNLYAEGRKRKRIHCEHITSWLGKPFREVWRLPYTSEVLDARKMNSGRNMLKLVLEFICSTGEEHRSIKTVAPCSFKYPEFSSNNIISFIPSGQLSDCPNICKDLWNLYVKQILCDVEIKTRTSSFWVHKIVLCARSPVFFAMFNYDMMEKTSKCVKIEDLEDSTWEKFLAFLYTDRFEEIQWDTALDLYYSADKYQVERLKILCFTYFMNKIDVSNVCDLLMLSDRHCDSILKSKVEDYIVRHHKEIFRSPTWKLFSDMQPKIAVKAMLCKYDEARENGNHSKTYKLSECTNAVDDFISLYQGKIISDVIIKTSRVTFPAHKTVLCAGSSTMRKAFANGKSTHCLTMEDLEDDTVSRLLMFLYTDILGVIDYESATKLYHAAVTYKIQRLKIKCSCFFLENITASNIANLLLLAHVHKDVKLKALLKDVMSLQNKKIIDCQGWVKCSKNSLDMQERPPKRARLI